MDPQTDYQTKLQINAALGQRATRVAVLIVESIHLGMDLIDEQRPAVIEALIEHYEKITRDDKRSSRHAVRQCLMEYSKKVLAEARLREHRLYHGITGDGPDETLGPA
jgi:hypothetical protein